MKTRHWLITLLILLLATLALASCNDDPPQPDVPEMTVIDEGVTDYVIVYPVGDNTWKQRAAALSNQLKLTGARLELVSESDAGEENVLLVGTVDRAPATSLCEQLAEGDAQDHLWGIAAEGSVIAIYANGDAAWERCLTYLYDTYVKDTTMKVPEDVWDLQILTYEQLLAEQIAQDQTAKEELLSSQAQKIQEYKDKIAAFDIADFGGAEITLELDVDDLWESPTATPIAEHPRLLFTAGDLPALRETFSNEDAYPELVAAFRELVNAKGDGSLPPKVENGPKGGDGSPGVYNYDPRVLIRIQAKAMNYLLTGEAYYGYEAIYMLMNNMLTLDIGYFQDDQWRRYGHTMYTAALVYDWCYDLLDADMQLKIISGVEHLLCSGYSSIPDGAHYGGIKMEMGFPPVKEGGTIVGHSSETQFMRDYLSFALAIFDEVPAWWDMIGGRLYEEYIPPRQLIYAAGMFPEGTAEYAQMRYMTDLRAMWLLDKAVGQNPYNADDVKQIVRSFLGHGVSDDYVLTTGDGRVQPMTTFLGVAFMDAYICNDPVVLSYIREYAGDTYNYYYSNHTQLSAIEVLICLSTLDESELDEDWREQLDTVQYNGAYYQQMIVRNTWDSDKTIAVLMKGAGRSSGGHDHESVGNFQIYYKGILTADAGRYNKYGTEHHFYYHEATIGHNGLLIYNPSLATTLSGYYSGGQIKISPTASGMEWFSDPMYETGFVTGVQYGYLDEAKTSPKYVYYANDMTKAYDAVTVDHVGRTMLVTYTEDETFPMIMFIFDNITADSPSFQKTFILQCVTEPTVDTANKTVTIDNGTGGKLVLTSLKGADAINVHGGDGDNRFYLPDSGKYLPIGNTSNFGPMWGRVDIRPSTGNKTNYLMNVLYVTDSETTKTVTSTLIETDVYIGATALDQTAIFMKDTAYVGEPISFTAGAGEMNYYVGGLAAGEWTVAVGATMVDTITVTEEGHFLTFTYAGSGTVTLTPVQG
ncbi:MAG: hypothetical protein IJW83_00175 [Clostridia bacterium]|nr:hypothetical protein [Clostridia bacterium]